MSTMSLLFSVTAKAPFGGTGCSETDFSGNPELVIWIGGLDLDLNSRVLLTANGNTIQSKSPSQSTSEPEAD